MRFGAPGFVGKLARWPESEQFFRLAKTAKQAMLVVSSMQPDAARRTTAAALIRQLLRQQQIKRFKKKGISKPDRVFRHSLACFLTVCLAWVNVVQSAVGLPPQHGTDRIETRSDFEFFAARADFPGAMRVREVKFLILDVHTSSPQLYFQNTKTFAFHYSFATQGLGLTLSLSQFNSVTYFSDQRHNLAGSLVAHDNYQPNEGPAGIYTLEFWPTDPVSYEHVQLAYDLVTDTMPFAAELLHYHAPGETQRFLYDQQREDYDDSGMRVISTEELFGRQRYAPLNLGHAYGLLRQPNSFDVVSARDIVILKTLPNTLSHVSGIITEVPQTPLSHINIKAKQNDTPNAYIRNASSDPNITNLIGQYVRYEVLPDGFSLTPASFEDVNVFFENIRPKETQVPPRDLSVIDIAPTPTIGFHDSPAFGAKAANVAELWRLLPAGVVPAGFAVPFYFYDTFMEHNGFYDMARDLIADPQFKTDPEIRRLVLKEFRRTIRKQGTLPEWMRSALDAMHRQRRYPPGTSLRCRSSTNNEDLPGFNGAGLYDSYTHHPHEGHIEKSMKQVWASLWNYRAFEERDFHRIDHFSAAMGVLVHRNYENEQVNGVAVTKNIFDVNWRGYYVNAQLGEDLVTNPDAASVPEEFLVAELLGQERYEIQYIRFSNAIPVGEHLLTKVQVFELADHMNLIQDHFRQLYASRDRNFAMDIEFKITAEGRLAIKQARPWIN
ncbi:MAG: hypothetical protein IIC50_06050 [Planctomycetes bacterium]|nr:hypothetical protein [Planctomycetota bacterium]